MKIQAGVSVHDALHFFSLIDTGRDSAVARGVKARAAAKVADALYAGSCTVQDSDWPLAVPPRSHDHESSASRAFLAKRLRMEVWVAEKWRQGKVLDITLGEAQRASSWQQFFPLLLDVQAILAARRKAIISVL